MIGQNWCDISVKKREKSNQKIDNRIKKQEVQKISRSEALRYADFFGGVKLNV